jgi:hypothetical protein
MKNDRIDSRKAPAASRLTAAGAIVAVVVLGAMFLQGPHRLPSASNAAPALSIDDEVAGRAAAQSSPAPSGVEVDDTQLLPQQPRVGMPEHG